MKNSVWKVLKTEQCFVHTESTDIIVSYFICNQKPFTSRVIVSKIFFFLLKSS